MGKGKSTKEREEDLWAQVTLAIGALGMVGAGLYAIKAKTGLPMPAVLGLTVGVLLGLGYGAWWLKTRIQRAWASKGPEGPAKGLLPQGAVAADQPQEPRHDALTAVLRRAGAIGKDASGHDEYIRYADVEVDQLPVGTRYRFLLPKGRTHEGVSGNLGTVASMFGVTRLHLKLKTSRDSERAVELLVLKAQPFSTPFDPPTRQEILTFAGVPLGHEITGELGGVSTFSKASMLIAGLSQMGKTTLVNGLITCLLIAYGEFEMYLLDGKFCGLAPFEKIATRYEASEDPAVLESILDELIDRLNGRYTKIMEAKKKRTSLPKFKPVFFIIDEAADFFSDNGTPKSKELVGRVVDKSRKLVGKSLESEISTIMITQRPDKDAIPTRVRSQFLYRICLYVGGEGDARVALGDDYFNTVAPINPVHMNSAVKGQAVVYAEGQSRLLRGFNFPDEFMWEVIDEVHERQQSAFTAALEEAPVSPLREAIDLMQGRGLTFIPTADLAPALGVKESTAAQQGKALSGLLGVKSTKDAKGVIRGYELASLLAAAKADV
ncbi:FtsK/SpoIIIE domain-containing protein [Streptomyces sp. NPDC058471]|uniref:FtsK/SpoIIIE domain-containing protein n=1 Tax=Streptomyces sp. NPDC058471 TaxID=3346516 RepID=UPI0036517DC5